ncbi:hypothetical protein N8654_03190 [Synechococcus sp. AH-601-B19]|nr:hypothetical protein [Synechococcus sp. AH-601-B19]
MATPAQRRIEARKRREEQRKRSQNKTTPTVKQSTPSRKQNNQQVSRSTTKDRRATTAARKNVNAVGRTLKNTAKGVVQAPGRFIKDQLRVQQGVQQLKDGKRGQAVNAEARPIGSKGPGGKVWAGQNYGYQSPASFQKLQKQGQFRAGEIAGGRVLGDLGRGVDQRIRQGAEDALVSGIEKGMNAYESAPEPVKGAVRGVGRGAQFVDDRFEDFSRATNTSRLITDEALTLGAGKGLKIGGKAVQRGVKSGKQALKAGKAKAFKAVSDVVTKPAPGTTSRPYRPAPQQIKVPRRSGVVSNPKGGKNPTKFNYNNNPRVGSAIPPSMRRSEAVSGRQYVAQGTPLQDGQFRSVGAAGAPSDVNSAAARFDAVAGPRIQGARPDTTDRLRANTPRSEGQFRPGRGAAPRQRNSQRPDYPVTEQQPSNPNRPTLEEFRQTIAEGPERTRLYEQAIADGFSPDEAERRAELILRSPSRSIPAAQRRQALRDADEVVGGRLNPGGESQAADEINRISTPRQSRPGTVRRSDVQSGRNQTTPDGFTPGQQRQAAKARQVRTRLSNLSPAERRRIIDRADPRLVQEEEFRILQEPNRSYRVADNNTQGLEDEIFVPRSNTSRVRPTQRMRREHSRRGNDQRLVEQRQRRQAREAEELRVRTEEAQPGIIAGQEHIAVRNRLAGNDRRQQGAVDRVSRRSIGQQADDALSNRNAVQRQRTEGAGTRYLMREDPIGFNNTTRDRYGMDRRPTLNAQRSGTSRLRNGSKVRKKQAKAVEIEKAETKRREKIKAVKRATKNAIARQKGVEPTSIKSSLKANQGPINPETGKKERLFTPENRAKALRKKGREVKHEYDDFDDGGLMSRNTTAGGKTTYQDDQHMEGVFEQGFKSINEDFNYMSDAELKAQGIPVRKKSKVDQQLNRANVGNQQGAILNDMEIGEVVYSQPIAGETILKDGTRKVDLQRAKLYKRQTKGALDYKVIDANSGYAEIRTTKIGPDEWETINGDVVKFDPESLGAAIDRIADKETPRRLSGRRLKNGGGSRAKLKISRKKK